MSTVDSLPFFLFTLPGRGDPEWFAASAALCVVCDPVDWGELCVCSKSRLLPHCDAGNPAVEARNDAVKLSSERFFESFVTPVRYVHYAPRLQIVVARGVLF
jgi:hypothetical protein